MPEIMNTLKKKKRCRKCLPVSDLIPGFLPEGITTAVCGMYE